MSRRWRWSLVAVIAAAFVGSFVPSALLNLATPIRDAQHAQMAEEPPTSPIGCLVTACGKGSPAAPAPVLTLASLAAVPIVVVSLIALARRRQRPLVAVALPRGVAFPLFHPPQFS